MKNATLLLTAFLLAMSPLVARAQWNGDQDLRDPYQYNDVDDGQLLKIFAYVLTPFGMGLEWGVTRPLHNLATYSDIAPLLAGDRNIHYFGHNNNADLVPPGTFDPAPINLSNFFVSEPPAVPAQSTQRYDTTIPEPPSQHSFR